MSKWEVYKAICNVCGDDTESEIEGDADLFLKAHAEEHGIEEDEV